MTTWGQEGGSLKSHLFIQIYRVLWGTWGTPLHPLCPRERGKSRPSLPLGDPWGTGGCPWRSVGEVRRAPPQRASPAPQAVTGPRALGSVWKAELRELEGRAVAWVCSWGGRGPALPLRTAWVRLALWLPSDGGGGGAPQGHLGLLPAQLPPSPGGWSRGIGGSKTEPGTFWRLGKADSQGHPALAALPPEGSQETRSGYGAQRELPETILEGDS